VALTSAERSKRFHKRHPEAARIRAWHRRMDAIVYLGGICKDCGYKDNLDALEFDHVRPKLYRAVGQLSGASWGTYKAELDRCELVCANCHAIRTAQRRRENRKHD